MNKPDSQIGPASDSPSLPSSGIPETNRMNTTAPKPFIFVLMPFSDEFYDVYNLGIRQACINAGTYCERVDEQVYDGTILERIYNQISNADYIVADMTGRNPNVFYEVGYAHALNKKVILLTQRAEDIPFDLSSYPHIVYGSVTTLQEELTRRLTWLVSNSISQSTYFQFPLKFFSGGQPFETISELALCRDNNGNMIPIVIFEIDVLNSPEKIISTITFRLGLICIPDISVMDIRPFKHGSHRYFVNTLKQQDGRLFHLIKDDFHLLPGDFHHLYFDLRKHINGQHFAVGDNIAMTLRILTDAGVNDMNLSFRLK